MERADPEERPATESGAAQAHVPWLARLMTAQPRPARTARPWGGPIPRKVYCPVFKDSVPPV